MSSLLERLKEATGMNKNKDMRGKKIPIKKKKKPSERVGSGIMQKEVGKAENAINTRQQQIDEIMKDL